MKNSLFLYLVLFAHRETKNFSRYACNLRLMETSFYAVLRRSKRLFSVVFLSMFFSSILNSFKKHCWIMILNDITMGTTLYKFNHAINFPIVELKQTAQPLNITKMNAKGEASNHKIALPLITSFL